MHLPTLQNNKRSLKDLHMHSLSYTMEQSLRPPMEKTHKIFRSSVHIFFQNYHHFTTMAAMFALPYSLSVLLSQALIPSVPSSRHFLRELYYRMSNVFRSAGVPPSSGLLSLNLSQAVTTSILTFPFSLFFLLPAKATIIQLLSKQKSEFPTPYAFVSLCFHLFGTYISSLIFILSANASALGFSFFVFGFSDLFGVSASSESTAVLTGISMAVYSILLANSIVVCNLALVISGMERLSGFDAILRAFVLSRGRIFTAMLLALPVNFGAAGISALFENRVVKPYYTGDTFMAPSVALEGILIAYLYALLLVLDTIASYVFLRGCRESFEWIDEESNRCYYMIIETVDE